MNVSSDLSATGTKICQCMSCLSDFSEVYIKLSHFSLHGFGRRAVLALNDSKSKDGRKIVSISLDSHRQIVEETRRIQHPVHFIG